MNEAIAEVSVTDCGSIMTSSVINREHNLCILAEDEGSNGCVIFAEVYRKAE